LLVVAAVAATGLLAACASGPRPSAASRVTYTSGNVTYASQADFLAAIQRQTDSVVAQVVPTGQRLGGTLLVVLPSTATVREIWTKVHLQDVNLDEMLAATGEINLVADAQAVKKGHAFDSVLIMRADAPEVIAPKDNGDPDYVLRFTTRHKWMLSNRTGATSELGAVNVKAALLAQFNAFNILVLNAAADLGAPVVRQPQPAGPA
jgi:hypothetical protein